eukprot:Gregarina_sp_Pseudo_9__5124@NODE_53_length_4794_cov_16_022713_g50_i0_p1_GENE_NODE_53_length_4794_cov_16_022713_g50_i0NODE_53_length_4794_cov_16_022713_g50_i0_p1_ORF_typecomplete_len800_score235_86IF4E/PF01652_18/2_9e03IF4E/PF01652_18/1_1e17_NODE_53_length_4794_cov_16_022713_g50_i04552854
MSPSGELDSTVEAKAAAVVLNERNPKEASEGETLEASVKEPLANKPEVPKLWSEFSDDEDTMDTTLAREQLRRVCLASVGVRPCDVPTTPPSQQSLQRTKTSRYSQGNTSPGRKFSGRRGAGGNRNKRQQQQDSLAVWQEAASKSRPQRAATSPHAPSPNAPSPNAPSPHAASLQPTSSTSKRRFGGLSLDALISYNKPSTVHEDPICMRNDSAEETPAEPPAPASEQVEVAVSVSLSPAKAAETDAETAADSSAPRVTTVVSSREEEAETPQSRETETRPEPVEMRPVETETRQLAHSSSASSSSSGSRAYVPRHSSAAASSDEDEDAVYDGPIEPRLREVNGDVIFDEKFDIWFTQPLGGSRRGLAKEAYEGGMHLIGSFDTLAQFFEFYGMLEWDDLPPSSVIAFCRHGIKPIWEDPANERGGRYLVKNFRREDTEAVFTKISLGFLSGMLHDWKHYNLISLHVRESRRGNDIQLWRSVSNNGRLTHARVKADLQDFVENSQPSMTLSFVPNRESLSRNDSRLQQQSGGRRSKGSRRNRGSLGPAASPAYTGGSGHPVFQLYSQKGSAKCFLAENQREAFTRESEAALHEAAPVSAKADAVSLSLTTCCDERLTSCDENGFSPVSSDDSGISFKRTDSCKGDAGDAGTAVPRCASTSGQSGSGSHRHTGEGDDEDLPLGSFRTRNSTAAENAAAFSGYPAPMMYYPPYPPYGYYMTEEQMNAPWFDATQQAYWMPNCAPPETFCLTPYAYPYTYTSKGTTYYSMPAADYAASTTAAAAATPAAEAVPTAAEAETAA